MVQLSSCDLKLFLFLFNCTSALHLVVEMFRTTAVYAHFTSTLKKTWAGGGFMNQKAMRPTSVLVLVHICGALTLSIPRYRMKDRVRGSYDWYIEMFFSASDHVVFIVCLSLIPGVRFV